MATFDPESSHAYKTAGRRARVAGSGWPGQDALIWRHAFDSASFSFDEWLAFAQLAWSSVHRTFMFRSHMFRSHARANKQRLQNRVRRDVNRCELEHHENFVKARDL